jgi:uncharacterized Zn-binding protein involved in type VI secretion
MPASVRLGDTCSGHSPFPSRPNDSGSPNVNANGKKIHRVGDHWITHCAGPSCHDSTAASGSPNVHANGIPKMRIGDSVACGSVAATGSSNYFINGA